MRLQKLFTIGFILLFPLFICGCGGTNFNPGGTPTFNELGQVGNTTVPALKIEADFPSMQVGQEVFLLVSIYPTGAVASVSDVRTVESATPIITQATPVGTPGSTLVNAFGPNYSSIGIATLETSPGVFSVTPTGAQTEPLDVPRVEWRWAVTPLLPGKQVIGVDIQAQWTSKLNGKQSLPYTLGFPEFSIDVQASLAASTPSPTSQTTTSSDNSNIVGNIILAVATIIAALITSFVGIKKFLDKRKKEASKPLPAHSEQELSPAKSAVERRRRTKGFPHR